MNEIIEKLSDLLGERPGLLPMAGVVLILFNLLLQIYPGPGSNWFVDSNLLLHLGVIMGLIGVLLVRVLS